ncbi:MAG: TonB-dependent receptor [Bacteroidia bacterium]|nr:TonB-dependent receptor [Bacteroidia bacterium]
MEITITKNTSFHTFSKIVFFITVFVFCTSLQLLAQTTSFSINGKAKFEKDKVVEFGNVIALSLKDSSIIKGAPFQNGEFKLDGLVKDSFLLKISSVGYKDFIMPIIKASNDTLIDAGQITLQIDNTLNEVTIVAKAPLFEMDGEKVKVNVEQTSLSSVGNALDVLKRSPSVMVSSSDAVTVFGKGAPIIYLDGMQISSIDILKSIPSSEIKSIEIINNPSAKYDAGGRAVINIITVKNNLEGYNGNIIQNTLYIKSLFGYTGLRLNVTKKKWSVNVGVGATMGEQWSSDLYKRTYKVQDTITMQMNNSIYDKQNHTNMYYYRAGINYRFDSTSTFGLQYNGFYNARNDVSENANSITQDDVEMYRLKTNTKTKPLSINNNVTANYTKRFDTLGTELFIAAQYGDFNIKNIANIHQETTLGGLTSDLEKRNTNQNQINIISSQIDFTKVFNKKWKLESGVKETYISKTSDIKFENYQVSDGWVSDPNYLNGFSFNENIGAAYSELRFKQKKLNARLGGRAELTHSDGFSKTTNQSLIERQYLNFFPSAFLGYDFTKDLTAAVTLSSRITRPTFQDLDPFINYIDSLTSFRGNSYLLPEYTYSAEASLIYMKEASLTFNYSRTNGALRLVVDKLNDGTDAFTATTKNLDRAETYSFGITIPYELKWWTTSNYFGYFLNTFTYNQGGLIIKNNKPTFSLYLYDEFRFKKICSLELNYEYTSSAVDGIFISKPFSMLSVTLKKTFFKDKLTCRVTASDVFSQYIMSGNSNIPTYDLSYVSRTSTHYYLLALNYKFGKLKNVNYQNRSVNDEQDNRVKIGK